MKTAATIFAFVVGMWLAINVTEYIVLGSMK